MMLFSARKFRASLLLLALALAFVGCGVSRNEMFFGKTQPPAGQVLRYVAGTEPGTLDPQLGTLQNEARIQMALFEGLCEYDPKNMEPIPAIAERWEVNQDFTEYVFHLRRNARWSNGEQITARDFVYSFRRGLSPQLASKNASLGFDIKHAEDYFKRGVFVRDPASNTYLLEKDFLNETAKTDEAAAATEASSGMDTEFHRYLHSPNRLVLAGKEKERAAFVKAHPKLEAALAGKVFEYEPLTAEHVGVEAVDDFTFRITLEQRSSFFLKSLAHPFFRLVPQKAIEQHGETWAQPERIVTCGAFRLQTWTPYHELIVVRDENYWDAARVRLDEIRFYPIEDNWAIMNLYKAGDVDATYNHTVPAAWLDMIRPLKDYMDAPETAISYYKFNITRPPMDDVLVRKAFNMAVDKVAVANWRGGVKPLTAFTPEGIFAGYPQPKGDQFDPVKARQLLAQAGYKDAAGNYDPQKFPLEEVEIIYNTTDSNKLLSEFLQAQWKQNLDLTIPLKSMESKTWADACAKLEYKGIARFGFGADYLDPFSFLNVFTTPDGKGTNGTGWYDAEYVRMLKEANRTLDQQKRYEMLAQAEARLLDAQPIIPLLTNATNWMKKPYVKGMYPNPLTMHPWKFVCIEHDPAKWDYGMPDLNYQHQGQDFKEREKQLPLCSQ